VKRLLIAGVAALVLGGIGLVVLARSVLTGANVRRAVESQLSEALGQPVTIGELGASAWPRVTMDLKNVTIGGPSRIRLAAIHLGTGLRPLFSRRIEHADVRVEGATVTLPLPAFGPPRGAPGSAATSSEASPIELVSIDEIVLKDVEVIGGTRTLRGDVELVPQREGLQIRRLSLVADDATIAMTGTLTSLSPMRGGVDIDAESLDVDRLVAFVRDFVATPVSTPVAGAPAAAAPAASPIDRLMIGLKVGRATTGALTFSGFSATAVVSPAQIEFEPLAFGVFGGAYQGSMRLGLAVVPQIDWSGTVAGIDAAKLMAFAGSPGTITGTLGGSIRLHGEAAQVDQALRSATGRARIDIVNGSIAGLQLVRTIVTASSGRGGMVASVSSAAAASREQAGSERFSRLGATLRLEGGVIATDDIAMTSPDVDLTASGTLRVRDLGADLTGRAQLSEALSKQAGRDLVRYTQENGRVTLPVIVSGPLAHLSVRVDLGDAAARAIKNKATEELNKAIQRGLGSLFKRPR
jgi:uncharacterized protein involved in outer membrane biogenesis